MRRRWEERRGRAAGFLIGALVALAPPPASAQDTNTDARRLLTEATTRMYAEPPQYAEALPLLLQARALRETPAVVYNLALVEYHLDRPADAYNDYQRYLDLAGSSADHRGDAERRLDELRPRVGRLTIHLQAIDATVTIDDRRLAP